MWGVYKEDKQIIEIDWASFQKWELHVIYNTLFIIMSNYIL